MFKIYFRNPDQNYEQCYYIEFMENSCENEQLLILDALKLLLESLKYDVDTVPFITENYIEFGPKLNFETPWCSNIKEIFKTCDTNIIKRIEKSKRVLKDSNIFEKEYDIHISYLTAASNCRAYIYSIDPASFHQTKGIAGKIIPAVATTTSAVVGLISFEFLKYCLGVDDLDSYQSTFLNIADNTIVSANPFPASKMKIGKLEITKWDKFEYNVNTSLGEFISSQEEKFKTRVQDLSFRPKIVKGLPEKSEILR